jgi:hydroxymethylglutaryl-CoA lyase
MFNYTSISGSDQNVQIVEVGPRDGLQNESVKLELNDKLEFINLLAQAGLKVIEVSSFVNPKALPQMSDAEALFVKVKSQLQSNLRLPCLVPNIKGYELAKKSGVAEISLFSATSDAFTQKNINASIDESFARMSEVAAQAKLDGISMRGYISTSYGCPYIGNVSLHALLKVIERFLDLGVAEISIGDTIGVARPRQVYESLTEIKKIISLDKIAMHFHDTRGMALSNILASLEQGVRIFDSSAGGLGGCPYAKGATGNVATEDVLFLMQDLGLSTGVDGEKVFQAGQFILKKLNKLSPSKFITAKLKSSYVF